MTKLTTRIHIGRGGMGLVSVPKLNFHGVKYVENHLLSRKGSKTLSKSCKLVVSGSFFGRKISRILAVSSVMRSTK